MKQASVSFRVGAEKIELLDAIAEALDRDRSYVINEAISAYLEIYRWQIEHIKEGLRQAEAEEFASEREVARVLKGKSH